MGFLAFRHFLQRVLCHKFDNIVRTGRKEKDWHKDMAHIE